MRAHHPGAEDSATSFLSPVAQSVARTPQAARRAFLPRHGARHRTPQSRNRNRPLGAGRRRPGNRDGFENLRALVTPRWRTERPNRAALPAKESPPPAAPVTLPAAGRSSTPRVPIATAASNPAAGCCCAATASSSAICSPAKPICRAGANCRSATAASKIAARCAVDALSMASGRSSSRCPSQSIAARPAQAPAPCQRRAHRNRRRRPAQPRSIVVPGERIPASPARASPSATASGKPKTRSKPPALTRRRRDPEVSAGQVFSTRMPHPFAPFAKGGDSPRCPARLNP